MEIEAVSRGLLKSSLCSCRFLQIQVFFDPTTFRIQVLDDGHGISRNDLSVLGVDLGKWLTGSRLFE